MIASYNYNPKSYYDETNNIFTVPFLCVVKVSASAIIDPASTGACAFRLYKGTALQYEMFYMKQEYNEQSGSGFHILSCIAGDILSLKLLGVCSVTQTNCSYEIL